MSDQDRIPEEIREKLLEEPGDGGEPSGMIDEIDLDQVAGGAYTYHNSGWGVTGIQPRFGAGPTGSEPDQP